MPKRVLPAVLLCALLAGCASEPQRHVRRSGDAVPPPDLGPRAFFISPMGEPFRMRGAVGADSVWFGQADSNHDGTLTLEEMVADADRFFTRLDVDRDGHLDTEEMSRYENEIAPQISVGGALGGMGEGERRQSGRRGGRRGSGGGSKRGAHGQGNGGSGPADDDGRQGAARFSYLNIPEPVAAADTDMDFIVTRDSFRKAAIKRFHMLDADHDGRITQAELPALPKAGGGRETGHRGAGGMPQDQAKQ